MQLSKNRPAWRENESCSTFDLANINHHSLYSIGGLVGVPGIEPGTSSLSGTRSNQLSYTPNGIADS